jgi:hypothetical protein
MLQAHGADGEAGVLDALQDAAGEVAPDGVRFDDRECAFHKLLSMYMTRAGF